MFIILVAKNKHIHIAHLLILLYLNTQIKLHMRKTKKVFYIHLSQKTQQKNQCQAILKTYSRYTQQSYYLD